MAVDDGKLRIQRDFVDSLERCASMRDESSRTLIVEALGQLLGAELSLRRQATARANITELVRVCAGLPRGFDLLTDQVQFMDRLAPELPLLRHLCAEWAAADLLPGLWSELRRTLLPVRLATSGGESCELARIARDIGVADLPARCDTVWRTFVYLAATPSGVAPTCVDFLGLVADRVPAPGAIRELNRRLAATLRPAGVPTEAERPRDVFYSLVDALEAVPTMRDDDTRALLVDQLGTSIAGAVPYNGRRRTHAINIVRACLDHEGGLAELITTIRHIEGGDSVPLRRLIKIVRGLPPEFTAEGPPPGQ